jgi:maltodextrin utilization protein YvdJ
MKITRDRASWWTKIVAIIAVVNLILVGLDLSYLSMRNFYLKHFPEVVSVCDRFKGIEPHRLTEKYLATVKQITPEVNPEILSDLRQQSITMIDENPFSVSGKVGTFAKIKKRMRQEFKTDSAKVAFQKLWSPEYFQLVGSETALSFFNREIYPLMSTNYFRDIDDSGRFVDRFWLIDIWFSVFFILDWLIGSFVFSWRNSNLTWFDALWQRWYDVLLVLPFGRWLRVIPVTIKLHQARLIDLNRLIDDISYDLVAYLADKVANFAIVRVIGEIQMGIQKGKLTKLLLSQKEYLTINDIDEQDAIADRFLEIFLCQVLPEAQPHIEGLLKESLMATLKESSFYQVWQKYPLIGNLPQEITGQIAVNLTQSVLTLLTAAYRDEEVRKVFQELKRNVSTNLSQEMRNEKTVSEVQFLLLDWLEEMKINFIYNATQIDPKMTLAEVDRLSAIKPL